MGKRKISQENKPSDALRQRLGRGMLDWVAGGGRQGKISEIDKNTCKGVSFTGIFAGTGGPTSENLRLAETYRPAWRGGGGPVLKGRTGRPRSENQRT